jgi:ABC-type nitrate/sulfonate/bicarbonate transport system permease component
MILQSQRGLRTDKIFVGLVTIGLLGFASDALLKGLHRRLLPWSPRLRS